MRNLFLFIWAVVLFPVSLCASENVDLTMLNNKISGYEYCGPFCHGAAKVRKDGKWGIINKKGDLLVPCKYDEYHNMTQNVLIYDPDREDGYCGVELRDKSSQNIIYCNKYGEPITPSTTDYITPYFDYNEYVLGINEKSCLYHNGKLLIDTLYQRIYPIKAKNMFYVVSVEEEPLDIYSPSIKKTGLLNSSGKVIVPLSVEYEDFRALSADCEYIIFRDTKSNKYGIMSNQGTILLPAEFQYIYNSNTESTHFLYDKPNGMKGFIGKDLKKMFEFDCDNIFNASMANGEEAYDIWKGGSYLFTVNAKGEKINKTQKVKGFAKLPANYEFGKRLNDDYILVTSSGEKQGNKKQMIMHKSGKLSKEYDAYNTIELRKDNYFVVKFRGKQEILDMDFNVVDDPGFYCGNYYYKNEGENKYICFYNTKREKIFTGYNFNEKKGTWPYGIKDPYTSHLHLLYAGYEPDIVVVREATSGKWGVIDVVQGKVVVPFIIEETIITSYDDFYKTNVDYFSDGLIAVRINGRWYYVDKNGNGLPPKITKTSKK